MKFSLLILTLTILLSGCSEEPTIEKAFSHVGSLNLSSDKLEFFQKYCGDNNLIKVDTKPSTVIRDTYISSFYCDKNSIDGLFRHYGSTLKEDHVFEMKFDYVENVYEIYSYNINFAYYIDDVNNVDKIMDNLALPIHNSFYDEFVDGVNLKLKNEKLNQEYQEKIDYFKNKK